MQTKRGFTALLLLAACFGSGCYYAHVAGGQTRLLLAREPVARLYRDPETPATLREGLALVEQVRRYAGELGLTVDGQYTSFVAAPGDRIVTTVVATRAGEIEPAGFWFPFFGRLPYKGFFDPTRAEAEAVRLRAEGLDVCVSPVAAYSTLGWFDDPLTGPMLRLDRARLVETVLHELVHATVYARHAPDFNEGVASFIGQEAAVGFFAAQPPGADLPASQVRAQVEDERRVALALAAFRAQLATLYAESPPGAGRNAARAQLETQARAALAALPLTHFDGAVLARTARLNDACQALTGTYENDLPRYARRLAELGGELPALLEAAGRAATEADPRASLGLSEVPKTL